MAYSYQRATSDGTMTYIDISIDYLDRSEISVYFDDVLTAAWSWSGTTDKRILFSPAVPNGVVVMVKRITDASQLRHEFSKGAAFIAETLDEDLKQSLHMAQEASEANLVGDFFTDINMHGFRVFNIGPAVDDNDALTLAQYKADADGAAAARDAAMAAEAAAAASAAQAAASAAQSYTPGLPASGSLVGTELMRVYQGGTPKQTTLSAIGSFIADTMALVRGVFKRAVSLKLKDQVNVNDFGAVGDGVSRPLSGITSFNGQNTTGWALVQWQAVFPHALALTDELDWCAIQAAIAFVNPNVWAASFNYQQGGGTVFLAKGVYRINRPIRLAPFVTLAGQGTDGWTGGGAGIGLTGPTSPANGSAIYADFGVTVQTCAIDTQNWSVSGGTLYPSTNMAPITVPQLGGTYTYCQNVGLRDLAVFCTNSTNIGIRLQGAALSKVSNVSVLGFKNSIVSAAVWSTSYSDIFSLSTQTGLSLLSNNAILIGGGCVFDLGGWGSSTGLAITNNNVVTAGNKPAWWSANDTNYNGTSLYMVSCFGIRYENVTTQHCGRSWYAEATDVTFGLIYIEDLPFLSSGSTPGAFNAYNAAASNFSVVIEHLHSDSNGVTLFNNVANTPLTLLSMSGIQGMTLGASVTGSTTLLLGNNVNRNGAFGDFLFDSRIISLMPTTGTWTPGLTNISGTGVTAAGKWVRRGNVYDCTVVISGTGITATGGGASILSTPFNGSGGFPGPAAASAAAVTTANLQAASGLMDTNANLYISAITSTTRIVISFQLYGA